MKILHPSFIVGIGGLAGGLKAYIAFFDAMQPNTGMAFVVISHLFPDENSQRQLAQILSRHTKMPVQVASMALPIKPNHVYVNPPNVDLLIENYAFKITTLIERNTQVDYFFTSIAEAMGARAIGIIFSGCSRDGTLGCEHIKVNGGTTFVQDKSADYNDMPFSAHLAGFVDFALPPDKIADALQRLASTSKNKKE